MPRTSEKREAADAKFAKTQKASSEAAKAAAEYEAESGAVRKRTVALKALRLAKEAADREAELANPKPAAKKRATAKKA